ncbi:galactose-binding domain-containing protein [Streptomyces tendae]
MASTGDANRPANVVDDDYDTRWSGEGEGDGAWLRLDLGSNVTVSHIKLAVYKGDIRRNVFELQYGAGSQWVTVFDGRSSGTTTGLQTFAFRPVQTSKVRYLGHGYDGESKGVWNSLTGVQVWGSTNDGGGGGDIPPAPAVEVDTAEELADALAAAAPGDTIELEPGDYAGTFAATAEHPIALTGPRDSILSNDDGYGLHLDGADHWNLTGFSVAGSAKGIVLDESDHVTIEGVEVYDTGAEAVHSRAASSDKVIKNSVIHHTGLEQPQYGEAIYVGSAVNHWDDFGQDGGEGPDRSDRNQALDNTIGPNSGPSTWTSKRAPWAAWCAATPSTRRRLGPELRRLLDGRQERRVSHRVQHRHLRRRRRARRRLPDPRPRRRLRLRLRQHLPRQ